MKTNQAGIDLIKSFESLQLVGYLPTPDDVPTIGYGHTGPEVRIGQRITEEEAEDLLRNDLEKFEDGVTNFLDSAATSENQFAAMVSLAFNIGLGNFKTSTVLRSHKAGDFAKAEAAFAMWNKQKGKVLKGLVRRREAEAELYATA